MKVFISLFLTSLLLNPLFACCMLQKDYKGTISQNEQRAIIIHHNGVQDMILSVNYKIEGEEMPSEFAWIISVPAKPDRYQLGTKTLFEKTLRWADDMTYIQEDTDFALGIDSKNAIAPEGALEVGAIEKVGPYEIQPVKALGMEGYGALNNWLKENGFPVETREHMAYFIENGFTFLCIKVKPAEGQDKVSASNLLEPLQITFKSEDIYYPSKYSSQQGNFGLSLATLTDRKINYKKTEEMLGKMKINRDRKLNVAVKQAALPDDLQEVMKKSDIKMDNIYLNFLESDGYNQNKAVQTWERDSYFTLVKDGENYTEKSGWSFKAIFLFGALALVTFALIGLLALIRKKQPES